MGKSCNFLFSCNRFKEKVKLRSFLVLYEHPPYLNDYAETARFEANKQTSF